MTALPIWGTLRAGGTMKAFVKLVVEFVGWRWAPAVALLTASMLYVLLVIGLVPSEIGVPVANTKFNAHLTENHFGSSETSANTYATSTSETTPVLAPARQTMRPKPSDFGKRGFSPPLDRPEPPPRPPAPTPVITPAPVMTNAPTRGPLGGIFSRLQGALRPGSVTAQALTQASQIPAPAPAHPAAAAEAPAAPVPPAVANAPSPPAPPDGAASAPPDNGATPAAPPPAETAPPGAPSVAPAQPPPPPGAAPSAEPAPAQ